MLGASCERRVVLSHDVVLTTANNEARPGVEVNLCWLRNIVSLPIIPSYMSSCSHNIRSEYDQELDSLLVGPVPVGTNKFLFQANAPSLDRIPPSEILGVTVILLSCAYDDREFVRVGYYVNNEYADEALNAEPPAKPVIEKVRRNILAEKPRVTRFGIKWYVAPFDLRSLVRN